MGFHRKAGSPIPVKDEDGNVLWYLGDKFISEWVADGFAEIARKLSAHREFLDWLDTQHDSSESALD